MLPPAPAPATPTLLSLPAPDTKCEQIVRKASPEILLKKLHQLLLHLFLKISFESMKLLCVRNSISIFFRYFSLGDIFFNSVSINCVTVMANVSQLPKTWSHLQFQWPMEWTCKLCLTNSPLAAHVIFWKIIWQLITKAKCWASGSSR